MVKKSFSIGLLPDEWKHADITSPHKKGSKSSKENYRPCISLTSIVCKINEKIVLERMIKFWRKIDVINDNRIGCRYKVSTRKIHCNSIIINIY